MAEAFGVAASALAVAELSVKVIALCLQYSRDVKHAKEDIDRIIKHVTSLENVANELQALLDGPHRTRLQASQKLRDDLESSQAHLRSLQERLTPSKARQKMRTLGVHAFKWPFKSKEVENILQELARCSQPITTALQIDQTNLLLAIDQKTVLSRLPIAAGAAFDSHAEEHNQTCLPDTRVDLFRQIGEWVEDPTAKAVFWLNGMAGTGKSTISRTLAHTSSDRGRLGASFFFKRGEGDRGEASKFFPTIAAQLVQREPALAPHVKHAIDSDPFIFTKSLRDQFEKLISEPLSEISSPDRIGNVLTIVIDALDECDDDGDIRLIIHLLSRSGALKPPQLRVFLTSRPELPIRLGFHDVRGNYQDLILHEIEQPIIEHDISVYFKHELARIRIEYNNTVPEHRQLQPIWPSSSDLGILIEMAIPLFIFAATACRFLADRRTGTPETNLGKILAHRTIGQDRKLYAMYLAVLDQFITGLSETSKKEVLALFERIVGSIVLLASPLSTAALAHLLDISLDAIDNRLDLLHSVLNIPSSPSAPVRLLHLSFRDFLLDPSRSDESPFWVDEEETHKQLALDCLRVLNKTLRTDICEVKWPGTPRKSIDLQTINSKLPPEVQYACQYWVYHFEQAGGYIIDGDEVHRFLQEHFLHWLEALSLIGRLSEGLRSVNVLKTLLRPRASIRASRFISHASVFGTRNLQTIHETPLQIYCSVLVFTPEDNDIRDTFQKNIPDWMPIRPNVGMYWNNCLQTLNGHTRFITSVAFSPDGAVIASGSANTIRLWSSETGEHLHTFEGHADLVDSVAFSLDGTLIVSGSNDTTIRLWSYITGEHLHTFEGHTSGVESVTFSPNDSVIASGSYDNTIRLWSYVTGEHVRTFEGHAGSVESVAFSPDGKVIASGSADTTIQLWSYATGENLQTFEGHTDSVTSVVFSPDGISIASGSADRTIRLWSSTTGQCLQTFEGHGDQVRSVTFSPDGTVIASASQDSTIKLWSWSDAGSEHVYTFEGHTSWVTSLAFSPDGTVIASVSSDETIRFWSWFTAKSEHLYSLGDYIDWVALPTFSPDGTVIASGSADKTIRLWSWSPPGKSYLCALEGHTGFVTSLAFSPDSTVIASGSRDKTIRIWSRSGAKSQHLHTLEGHSGWVTSLAFSPDGERIASGSSDNTVQLWLCSAARGEHLDTLQGHTKWITSLAFSPDRTVLASGSCDTTIRLWSLSINRSEHIRTFEGHFDSVISVAFSPDGTFIASGSADNTIRLWSRSASTGNCFRIIDLGIPSHHLSFDPGSQLLYTAAGAIPLDDITQLTLMGEHDINGPETAHTIRVLLNGDQDRRLGYGISRDYSWITLNGKNLVQLPLLFRPYSFTMLGSTVAIGTVSGKVLTMQFSAEGPPGL
ncbi:hypothetical protein O1611_g3342 [Lasiodiplodia mahajangana]|uniref:Uncharacterized protein n=1 Tax=Lasiodiplodia mahajangana TaxID=1108764 RepID=A0ACC2JS99_9PEZI|nr:hypothetical protein O1611_g3342 [Lasiodiplodia mahajangana]